MYQYLYNMWSRVSLPKNENLFVNINMLPLTLNKTRWLVTLRHNYWQSYFEKFLMEMAARCILMQDSMQLCKQADENMLKQLVMHNHRFHSEQHFDIMKDMFSKYDFPDLKTVTRLYLYHQMKNSPV